MPNVSNVTAQFHTNHFWDNIFTNPIRLQYKKVIKPKVEEVITIYKVTPLSDKQALLRTRGNMSVAIIPITKDIFNALNVNKKAYIYGAFVKHVFTVKGLAPIQDW